MVFEFFSVPHDDLFFYHHYVAKSVLVDLFTPGFTPVSDKLKNYCHYIHLYNRMLNITT